MARRTFALAAAALAVTRSALAAPGSDLPAVNVDSMVTVSGLSSGAFMAVQMHFTYSTMIKGMGALAGGPYWCAQDVEAIALTSCMTTGGFIDVSFLGGIVEATALTGFIDPPVNLVDARVWLFSATNDTVVDKSVVKANQELYQSFTPTSQTKVTYNRIGEHAQQTTSYGNECTHLGTPYINNCGFDAAGDMLQWLFDGSLTPPNATGPNATYAGLYSFDQAAFLGGQVWSETFGVGKTAYLYAPQACLADSGSGVTCKLHVAFHGCEQTTELIGTDFVQYGGYLPWAEANNIVVLFPQAISNLLNPKGCWDWWGYTGTAYASNLGVQTSTVKRIIDALMGGASSANNITAEAVGWQRALDPAVAAAWARTPMAVGGKPPVVVA